ncbi:MAG: GNAT family N-acetyltransferase [Bacteroidia bacterium]|nr:GNAT family N-acetyltransferase [Bacteroidia bacterium]
MPVTLRKYTLNDLDELVKLGDNPNISKFMMNRFPSPYTKEKGVEFINHALSHTPTQLMAIDLNGKFIGAIGVHPMDDVFSNNAEFGYWIGETYWGNGYATEAVKLMVDYVFSNFKITRIFLRIFSNNKASLKLAEKTGFTLEAKFEKTICKNGELLDEFIYAKRK